MITAAVTQTPTPLAQQTQQHTSNSASVVSPWKKYTALLVRDNIKAVVELRSTIHHMVLRLTNDFSSLKRRSLNQS